MIKKLSYVAGIISVAGALSACSTSHGYASNEPCGTTTSTTTSSTAYEASGAQPESTAMTSGEATQAQGNQVAIPLYEERVSVGKQAQPSQVQIRKYTTTETVSVPVELRHEHVVVERAPAGAVSGGQFSGQAFQDKAITLDVQNEQPIVQKQTVQTGSVIARKDSETQRINVQQQVRKEDVAIDRGNNPNVELRGGFNEPAGAQPNCPPGTKPMKSDQDQDNR